MKPENWIEDYKQRKLGVWICPYKEGTDYYYKEWKEINTETLYEERSTLFDWSSAPCISLVTGKKGCMVLVFGKDTEKQYSEERLKEVLSILGLPEKYNWIVESNQIYGIVLDIHSMPKGSIVKRYRDFWLVWEDYFMLPPGEVNYPREFKYGMPTAHPIQLSWQRFQEGIEEIKKLHLNVDVEVLEKRKREERMFKATMGGCLFVLLPVVTGFITLLEGGGFDLWLRWFIFALIFYSIIIFIMSTH